MKKLKLTLLAFFVMPLLAISQTTVVDIVVNSPDHETLEAAVIAADLAGTLSGPGPFTLFAPTDTAFDALPAGTVDDLLADPSGALTDILLYHTLAADVRSTDLSNGQIATTINGKDITVSIDNGNVFINDAQVTVADIVTDNGVVHVIDAVLIPPVITVVDIVVNSPDHETLEAAVIAADLAGTLSGDGPFTLFAPTDAAFEALPDGTLDALLADPSGDLTDILLYHTLAADVRSTDLSDGQMATTINGQEITVSISNGNVFINDAQVTVADIVTDNGVVHVIDGVLLPNLSSTNESEIELASFKIYPNPASDFVQLEIDNLEASESRLLIRSLDGRIVQSMNQINSSEKVDVSQLQSGMYLIEYQMDNMSYVKKLAIK